MSFSEFSKVYGVNKKKLYKLAEKPGNGDFVFKDGDGHWVIDASKPEAKRLGNDKGGGNDAADAVADRREAVKRAREEKQIQDARLARIKADQEELKLSGLSGKYIDVETMRYYFSYFQRGITDSFSAVKKISKDLKRLYSAGKEKEAEKKLLAELHICFTNAMKGLEDEIRKGKHHA